MIQEACVGNAHQQRHFTADREDVQAHLDKRCTLQTAGPSAWRCSAAFHPKAHRQGPTFSPEAPCPLVLFLPKFCMRIHTLHNITVCLSNIFACTCQWHQPQQGCHIWAHVKAAPDLQGRALSNISMLESISISTSAVMAISLDSSDQDLQQNQLELL